MVKSQCISITPATHADRHRHGGDDPLTGDVRIDALQFLNMSDVLASRAFSTIYQNTTDKSMLVNVAATDAAGAVSMSGYVENATPPTVEVAQAGTSVANKKASFSFIVPAGHYYKVEPSANDTLTLWVEWY